jgi:hypothetical protein
MTKDSGPNGKECVTLSLRSSLHLLVAVLSSATKYTRLLTVQLSTGRYKRSVLVLSRIAVFLIWSDVRICRSVTVLCCQVWARGLIG